MNPRSRATARTNMNAFEPATRPVLGSTVVSNEPNAAMPTTRVTAPTTTATATRNHFEAIPLPPPGRTGIPARAGRMPLACHAGRSRRQPADTIDEPRQECVRVHGDGDIEVRRRLRQPTPVG